MKWNTLKNADTDFSFWAIKEISVDETSKEVANVERKIAAAVAGQKVQASIGKYLIKVHIR